MSERRPAFERRRQGGEVDGLQSWASDIDACPLIRGRTVVVSMAGVTSAFARHGLGRRYVGAIVIGANATAVAPVASTPAVADAAGVDSSEYVRLTCSASVTADFTLWVF